MVLEMKVPKGDKLSDLIPMLLLIEISLKEKLLQILMNYW
jgi:hypothetical protein